MLTLFLMFFCVGILLAAFVTLALVISDDR
jgi:hypothetical protein